MAKNQSNEGTRSGHSYQLNVLSRDGRTLNQSYFDSYSDLAIAVYRLEGSSSLTTGRWYCNTSHWFRATISAYSTRGALLNIEELVRAGETFLRKRYSRVQSWWSPPGYTRRQGAVWGIRKSRGGRSYRNHRSMAIRRQNALWLPAEGEVECRPRQRDTYLFHSWDGRYRSTEKCWKAQHKGRKAWDN